MSVGISDVSSSEFGKIAENSQSRKADGDFSAGFFRRVENGKVSNALFEAFLLGTARTDGEFPVGISDFSESEFGKMAENSHSRKADGRI